MKIHLPKHKIEAVSQMDVKDIPIGYIDTTDATYNVGFSLDENFAKDEQKEISAYDVFKDNEIFLFNENKELLRDLRFKRQGNSYIYEPNNSKEFQPLYFSCSALIKRRMTYSSGNHYNLRVGVAEAGEDFALSSVLISAFGDANKRGICPANVTVNGGSKIIQSLLSNSDSDADFIFVTSNNGEDLRGLDIDAVMDKHLNLWVSADNLDTLVDIEGDASPLEEGQLCTFYKKTKRKKISPRVFDQTNELKRYPKTAYEYSYPYEDVLILHKPDKGYIVITPREFLENTADNSKIIYDVLMYIFLNAYRTSRVEESWIVDKPVDCMAYSSIQLNTYHKRLNLTEMLASADYDLNDEYNILQINSSRDDVLFVKLAANKDLFFRKTSDAPADPIKEEGYVSFLTTKGTVLMYKPEKIYSVRSRAILEGRNLGREIAISLQPLYDSEKHIYLPKAVTMKLGGNTDDYYICVTPCIIDGQSTAQAVHKNEYKFSKHGYIVARVEIETVEQPKIIDIRVAGGGLPLGEKDVYSLIDIGNINGRPYRVGSTLVIRLPKRLEGYRDIIEQAVKSHIAAGEYPVVLFE